MTSDQLPALDSPQQPGHYWLLRRTMMPAPEAIRGEDRCPVRVDAL